MDGYSHFVAHNIIKLGSGGVSLCEELGAGCPHGEVHVQLPLALLQGEAAASQEGHHWRGFCKTGLFVSFMVTDPVYVVRPDILLKEAVLAIVSP